jgi:hypothetical protein
MNNRMMGLGLALALLVPVAAHAQPGATPEQPDRLHLGGKLGLNVASISTDANGDSSGVESRIGVAMGVFVRYVVSDVFSLQPEWFYTTKGAKLTGGSEELIVNLSYLEIPLLARVGSSPRSAIQFYGLAGVGVGVLIGAKLLSENGAVVPIQDQTSRIDLGAIVGAGVLLANPDQRGAMVEARYEHGLSNLDDTDSDETNENRVFTILVGYQF